MNFTFLSHSLFVSQQVLAFRLQAGKKCFLAPVGLLAASEFLVTVL